MPRAETPLDARVGRTVKSRFARVQVHSTPHPQTTHRTDDTAAPAKALTFAPIRSRCVMRGISNAHPGKNRSSTCRGRQTSSA